MIIQSTNVWIADQFIPAQIEIENGIISNIFSYNEKKADVDYENNRIVPGFIDIHAHGGYGWDTNDATEEGLLYWLNQLPKEGVTGICPTTITQSKDVLKKALENVSNIYFKQKTGAQILGIHFEGPYLDTKYKGAQPEQYIVPTSVEEFQEYQTAAKGLIKIITLAPEHDKDYSLTRFCAQHDVVVSIGHSNANYNDVLMAIANGAKSITHVYNGMPLFHHRDNGIVGAALRCHHMYGEVICDGNHSSLSALSIYFQAKGKHHAIMVSDSLMAKGKPVGSRFLFGGQEIEIYPDGSAHLTNIDSLAGSTLKINEGLKLLVEQAQIPFDVALNSCTVNPATLLNIDDKKGKIQVNYDADIVVLQPDYSIQQTYCKGIPQI